MSRRQRSARKRRLERRRQHRESLAALYWEDEGLVVCERCGLLQPFAHSDDGKLAPCVGPLGIPCSGEHATTLEDYVAAAG